MLGVKNCLATQACGQAPARQQWSAQEWMGRSAVPSSISGIHRSFQIDILLHPPLILAADHVPARCPLPPAARPLCRTAVSVQQTHCQGAACSSGNRASLGSLSNFTQQRQRQWACCPDQHAPSTSCSEILGNTQCLLLPRPTDLCSLALRCCAVIHHDCSGWVYCEE